MKRHHSISVRTAAPADLEQVCSLEQLCSYNPWSRASIEAELSNPDAVFLLLETPDGFIAGFAAAWLCAGELQILEVAVHRDYRDAGLGTLLITRQLAEAQSKGAIRACLEVRAANTPAIRLYEKCGFTKDGVRAGYYQDGEDAVLMSKLLDVDGKPAE